MKLNRYISRRYIIICISALALAACSENKEQKENMASCNADDAAGTLAYSGVIPAADGPGISCTLQLLSGTEKGNYLLTQQFDEQDTTITITKGSYELKSDPAVKPSGKYYRLISISNPGDTLYFAVSSDTTITMLTPTLQSAPSGLDYTLTKK